LKVAKIDIPTDQGAVGGVNNISLMIRSNRCTTRNLVIQFSRNHAQTPESVPMAEPIQLPLFPDQASLIRIRPERNEWRFYRMAVWPDLFGRALLARQWGRIGTQGRVRLDPHPDAGAAINALAQLARAKRRRGYRDLSA